MAYTGSKILVSSLSVDNGARRVDEFVPLTTVSDISNTPPADNAIASLAFSATPTQSECEALRDQCEILRDCVAELVTKLESLRNRLKETGGAGIIEDPT